MSAYAAVVVYAVLGLPLAALLVLVRPRLWADVGLVYGTVPWICLTMIPGVGAGEVEGRVSLIPFKDLFEMGSFQAVGNLFVLAALGFFGPVRFAALRSVKRVMIAAAIGSASIEIAQYVLMLDRVSSIDDVLLNTVGAGMAALLSPGRSVPSGAAAEVGAVAELQARRVPLGVLSQVGGTCAGGVQASDD